MKKIYSTVLFSVWLAASVFGQPTENLTKEDRKAIISYLKKSQAALIAKVKDLSLTQWTYKPAPDVWSVAEICEHILKAEEVVLNRVENIVDKAHKPELIAGYQEKGEELVKFIVAREKKFQAPERVQPAGTLTSPDEFITEIETRRSETIKRVKSIDKPIKAYYEVFGPIGEVNGYQWLLFISAHTERHTIQLEGVLADPEFPM